MNIDFGTDGIRGNAYQFPFTPSALHVLGKAIAHWSIEKYPEKKPHFLIAHDTRESAHRIEKDLISGLAEHQLTYHHGHILPTPAVLQLIKRDPAYNFGIMISASHNPHPDNGIKLFDATSGKLTSHDEENLIRYFDQEAHRVPQEKLLEPTSEHEGNFEMVIHEQLSKKYATRLLSFFPHDMLKGKKIVLDASHGSAFYVGPIIFKALGATVITIGANPNGRNINDTCGALKPQKLRNMVLQSNADCGFAFDGDGDRVTAVTADGTVKDGDDLLALLLQHPQYCHIKEVVGTIMTNQGFQMHLQSCGKKLIHTRVGDKYVQRMLEKKNLTLGGETSGHVIMTDYLDSGDGIFTALRALESVIAHNNWNFVTFNKFPQVLLNIPVQQKKPLTSEPFESIVKRYENQLPHGRLIVRYSGTENFLRIMVEDQSRIHANHIAQTLATTLQKALTA